MTTDTDPFTLSLFDNTPAPAWNHHTSPTSSDAHNVDEADGADEANDDTDEGGAASALAVTPVVSGSNFRLDGDRDLARGWAARDNITAITLSKALEQSGNTPTGDEQAQLLRFIGFGATELAQNCFRRPGEEDFRCRSAVNPEKTSEAVPAAIKDENYSICINNVSANHEKSHAMRYQNLHLL